MQIPLKNMPRAAPQNRPIGGITPRSTINTAGRGGQRDALFAQLSALGDIVHNSAYNCVTRVNFSGAGRNMAGIADDVTDLAATTGIDMVGEDIYYSDWDNIDGYLQPKSADNLTHLAECAQPTITAILRAKFFQ